MRLTLLLLALGVPATGFLLPGLGRPSFGHAHVRCGLPHASAARCRRPPAGEVFAHGPQLGTELALMDPPQPYKDKDDAAKREFELNRGQAVDTLLADYPSIFAQQSDFSIFHERVVLRDSKGFSLEGIRAYKVHFSDCLLGCAAPSAHGRTRSATPGEADLTNGCAGFFLGGADLGQRGVFARRSVGVADG